MQGKPDSSELPVIKLQLANSGSLCLWMRGLDALPALVTWDSGCQRGVERA